MDDGMGMLEKWDDEVPKLISIDLGGPVLRVYETSKVNSFLSKIKAELEAWQKFQDELEKNDIIQYTGDSEEPWIYGPAVRTSEKTGEEK